MFSVEVSLRVSCFKPCFVKSFASMDREASVVTKTILGSIAPDIGENFGVLKEKIVWSTGLPSRFEISATKVQSVLVTPMNGKVIVSALMLYD